METLAKYKLHRNRRAHSTSVFIVDDDIAYLYPLVFYLKRKTGYKIYCYTTGEDCMRNIDLSPLVVILDYNLNPHLPNKMDGMDVLKRIRRVSPETKVIVLSGRDTYQAVENSLKTGAYSYVLKDAAAISSIKNILYTLCGGTSGNIETDTT